jgi:iron complex transport system ATP-binding protein
MQDLSVGYGTRRVLEGISANLGRGQFVTLLGPNGAGKTTLLRTLARLLNPVGGAVFLQGKDIAGLTPSQVARSQAVVLTERVNPGLITVSELVSLGRHPHTGFQGKLSSADRQRVVEALEAVKALDLAGRRLGELSDGERQKVMIARALAQDPALIILDEPTMHLDLKHRLEVMNILRRLCRQQGITVLASLHEVDLAARVSDMVALVKEGRITQWGPPEQLLSDQAVASLYGLDHSAHFSHEMGVLELNGDHHLGPVFVAAGGGSGVKLFRLLTKRAYGIQSGVLHTSDIDHQVARALGAELISQEPFQPITPDKVAQAQAMLQDTPRVIDAGFPVSDLNRANLDLIRTAARLGRTVHSLRPPEQANALFNGDGPNWRFHAHETDLVDSLAAEN